jgi:RND family efflux transporter MFP subunit
LSDNNEEALRAEIEALRRQLEHRHAPAAGHGHGQKSRRPSAGALWGIALAVVVVLVVAFFAGYLPQSSRETALAKESRDENAALPIVNISTAKTSSGTSQLVLPGSIQAITEAPILARASGYIKTRLADIGDHVKEGQLLAEIDAVETEHQVMQAKAQVEQAKAALDQVTANLNAGKTNAEMARLTAERWTSLVEKGAVARQDADTYRAQYDAQRSNVESLEKAVGVARSNITGAESNVDRLLEMQTYLKVKAPFTGVITQRNVDTGALVNEGSTLLFRIAQTDRLRTFVNVPQADAVSIHVGQTAQLTITSLPEKKFNGTVTRTSNSLDPSTRTLLAEIQVSNSENLLLPGMYAQVNFSTPRAEPPVVIPGDTLILRADGPQVAVVGAGDVIHYTKVQIGRDYGDRMEVLSGISPGDRLVVNPGDTVREGVKVKPILLATATK